MDESGRMCRGQKRGREKEGRIWKKKKKKKQKTRRKRMRENEEGRKEGVRVRVRLGVGGAIRNYCGTIDKRRLRGRTTEDSLRPSDFPSTASPPFRLFSLFIFLSTLLSFFSLFSWISASASRRSAVRSRRVLPTKPSRLVNM